MLEALSHYPACLRRRILRWQVWCCTVCQIVNLACAEPAASTHQVHTVPQCSIARCPLVTTAVIPGDTRLTLSLLGHRYYRPHPPTPIRCGVYCEASEDSNLLYIGTQGLTRKSRVTPLEDLFASRQIREIVHGI